MRVTLFVKRNFLSLIEHTLNNNGDFKELKDNAIFTVATVKCVQCSFTYKEFEILVTKYHVQ